MIPIQPNTTINPQPDPHEGQEGDIREGGFIEESFYTETEPFKKQYRRRYGNWVKHNGQWRWQNIKVTT